MFFVLHRRGFRFTAKVTGHHYCTGLASRVPGLQGETPEVSLSVRTTAREC